MTSQIQKYNNYDFVVVDELGVPRGLVDNQGREVRLARAVSDALDSLAGNVLLDENDNVVGFTDGRGGANSLNVVPRTLHIWGNPDGTTRQGTFVVPAQMFELDTTLVAPGGAGGAGGALGGGTVTGGGGGSCGETIERAKFAVFPGQTLYFQIGGYNTTDPSYIRHTSHTGQYLSYSAGRQIQAVCLAGGPGGAGTGTTSGSGAAGTGSGFNGRTAGAVQPGITADANGNAGAPLGGTFGADRYNFGQQPGFKAGGLGGACGACAIGGSSRNGGLGANAATCVDGTLGMAGAVGQASGGTGDATHAGGGAGANPIITSCKSDGGNGGGSASYAGNHSFGPGGGGGGGATGFPGGHGGPGHMIFHNWPSNAISSAPPAMVVYDGAGLEVPADYVGIHATIDIGRLNNLTGNAPGGKCTLGTDRPYTDARFGGYFRSGTPPRNAATGLPLEMYNEDGSPKLYYILPFGATPADGSGASASYNTIGLSFTEDGPQIITDSAGTSARFEVVELEPPEGTLDYAWLRMQSCTDIKWGYLHTGDGTYNSEYVESFDRLARRLVSLGRKLFFVFDTTPTTFATTTVGTSSPYGVSGGDYPATRVALTDGKIPIRQFTNWLLTRYGPSGYNIIAGVELWNEPPGTGTNFYYKGSMADLVRQTEDIHAEIDLMGLTYNPVTKTGIPLIGPAGPGGASAVNTLRGHTGTLYSFLTTQASGGGAYGRELIDIVSAHPYTHSCAPIGPDAIPIWRDNLALFVPHMRLLLTLAGVATASTMEIIASEQGFEKTPTDELATRWPQMPYSFALLGNLMAGAGTGLRHYSNFIHAGWQSRFMARNPEAQGAQGDVHRHLAGKTLLYMALGHDYTWLTETEEEGWGIWRPRFKAISA